jgi:hypothetical protein
LSFTGDDEGTFKWMTGTHYYETTFTRFAALLGYPFDGPNHVGHRIHSPTPADKEPLSDSYGPKGTVGEIARLLPLYDLLVRIFWENIAPSGGNNDAIHASLVDLLLYAHECAESMDPDAEFSLDVMDFIYNEMFDAMVNKGSLPYAPFIMRLIQDKLKDHDFSEGCVEHKVKRLYVKKVKPEDAPVAPGSFMGDACWGYTKWVFTSDVVLNQQARVAHGGGMADCLPGGPVAGKPMADTGRRSLWRIQRQAHGGLPCSTRIGLSLGLHIVSTSVPS